MSYAPKRVSKGKYSAVHFASRKQKDDIVFMTV